MPATKITNPLWLGVIAPNINDFVKKVTLEGITYESLYSYFAATIQFGGESAEFWVAMKDGKPVAFAHWYVMGLPHIGKTMCDYAYSWSKNKEDMTSLIKEWINFGLRKKAPIYSGIVVNESFYRVWRKHANKLNLSLEKKELISIEGRKLKKDENIHKNKN